MYDPRRAFAEKARARELGTAIVDKMRANRTEEQAPPNAPAWRALPATRGQTGYLRGLGYSRAAVQGLSRGEAFDLISKAKNAREERARGRKDEDECPASSD